jgi:hypothetical protein
VNLLARLTAFVLIHLLIACKASSSTAAQPQVIDGGELYYLRTPEEFKAAYTFRKSTIASEDVDSPFIPVPLRKQWPTLCAVTFGVSDEGTNPKELRSTLANALRQSDTPVWFYSQTATYLLPSYERGAAKEEWVDAIRGARKDAGKGSLIYFGSFGIAPHWTLPKPSWIAANTAFLDTQPFDGLIVYLANPDLTFRPTLSVLSTTPVEYADIAECLSPMVKLRTRRLVNNYGLISVTTLPDMFDDWSVPVQNCANLARALKTIGIHSICFDNEQYDEPPNGPWRWKPWAWYSKQKYAGSKSLSEYQAQTRLRGKQIMQALLAENPNISIMMLHGPYISETKAPAPLFPQFQSSNELFGPFFAGMLEVVSEQK